MSRLFSQTLRKAPAGAEVASHELLLRAGFIRQLATGIFSMLPLARRSLTKIENIIREEMNAIGGQEITMPVVNPAEIWQKTGRWYQIGSEMGRFKDKAGRDMVLAMTHEEVVADLVRNEIQSYRQLPALLYHIQTKWRDDPRPRAGLIRVREFTMKDSYSLDADWDGLDRQYRAHYQAYFNIFNRCKLPVIAVKSDVGMMGGQLAHEFMYLTPIGEDTLILCDACSYAANRQIARFRKPAPASEAPRALEKVATPQMKTIEEVAGFLNVAPSKTAKAVFMIASIPENETTVDRFVFAIVRGDMEVNETKLANALKATELRPATEDEICATGAVPGYASPMGLKNVLIVIDDLIPDSPNLVSGANAEGYHFKNVNYGRDFQAAIVADIAAARDGDKCPECGAPMRAVRGIEVGNIFKLGTRYSDAFGCTFLDHEGNEKPVIMGSYGIGSGRLLASIAERHHDEYGLILPITVAPFQVHLVMLNRSGEENEIARHANLLYERMQHAGIEVLFDDRPESPGVKFNDADLIGVPLRVTIGKRFLQTGNVEVKRRDARESTNIAFDEAVTALESEIRKLKSEIDSRIAEVTM
ncbi:proline--tRNA ligase [candidate division KSB1 bacterium]|nr:proline--tRNA ligase [candidate division KSB1 bacterium]